MSEDIGDRNFLSPFQVNSWCWNETSLIVVIQKCKKKLGIMSFPHLKLKDESDFRIVYEFHGKDTTFGIIDTD